MSKCIFASFQTADHANECKLWLECWQRSSRNFTVPRSVEFEIRDGRLYATGEFDRSTDDMLHCLCSMFAAGVRTANAYAMETVV